MSDWHIFDLETGLPLQEPDMNKVSEFMENNRILIQTELATCWISTVFLGLDHSHGSSEPVVFETLVFPSKDNLSEIDGTRYETRDEALEGHKRFVEKYTSDLEVLSKAYNKPKKEAR